MTVELITETVSNRQNTPDKGVIHIPGGMEGASVRFHHASQARNLKLNESPVSEIFHVIFSDHG